MPEGDTVWLVASRLNDAFAGSTLVSSDLRVPALATTELAGAVTSEVVAYGKHLLWRLENRGAWTLHSHLRMDGAWHLYPPTSKWRGGPGHWIRAVMRTENQVAVGYRLAMLSLVPTAQEATVIGHLGPDLLDPDLDRDLAAARWSAQPDLPIGEVLLDQRVVAGLGTHLVAEVCFLRGVHPLSPIGSTDVPALLATAVAVIAANRTRVTRNTTGRPQDNSWVYGRRTCLRCGHRTERVPIGQQPQQRQIVCCPRCQRAVVPATEIVGGGEGAVGAGVTGEQIPERVDHCGGKR